MTCNIFRKTSYVFATTLICTGTVAAETTFTEAFTEGKPYGDFRLRYENVDQDNPLDNANALTLRTRLGYQTGDYHGLSGLLEFEDSRSVAGVDDFNNTQGKNTDHSVVADPETTEVDQAVLQYTNSGLKAKLGRQVIVYDNHRFVGHVGWRQDRQTFDALRLNYSPLADLSLDYAYLNKRNRIFAEAGDIDSKDHLINASYQTGVGTLVSYAYLLEVDEGADNSLDTYGLRYAGKAAMDTLNLLFELEFASQEADAGTSDFDANYYKALAGVEAAGLTFKLSYEVLGSDDGDFGFSTPLATLHAHNGWTDQFLGTPGGGLEDLKLAVSGSLAKGKWMLVYHDFNAEDAPSSADDLGSEVGVSYKRGFGKHYSAGIKYASYMAGDDATGKVDTDKLWLTLGARF